MKATKIILFTLFICFRCITFADAASSAAGAALTAGAIFGLIGVADHAVSPFELQLFTDPEINSTSQINYFDGLLIESRILDVVPGIYVLMIFKNETDKAVIVDANKIKMIFSNGLERYPDQDRVLLFSVEPKQKMSLYFKATKKSDFNNQNFLNIEIPVAFDKTHKNFVIHYAKNPNFVEKEQFDNTLFDFGLEFGPAFFTGQTKDQSERNVSYSFGINFDFYWAAQHGIILGFKSIDYKLSDSNRALINSTGDNFRTEFYATYVGYTYRYSLNEKTSLNTSILFSGLSLRYLDQAATYETARETTAGLRVECNYLLSKLDRGVYAGTYLLNYGIDYFYLSSFKNNLGDLSGGVGSAFIGFKMGF